MRHLPGKSSRKPRAFSTTPYRERLAPAVTEYKNHRNPKRIKNYTSYALIFMFHTNLIHMSLNIPLILSAFKNSQNSVIYKPLVKHTKP